MSNVEIYRWILVILMVCILANAEPVNIIINMGQPEQVKK